MDIQQNSKPPKTILSLLNYQLNVTERAKCNILLNVFKEVIRDRMNTVGSVVKRKG